MEIVDQELLDWMTETRRELHQHPELANEELATTQLIKDVLNDHDIDVWDNYPGTTGVVAEIGTGLAPFVALRADIDALPLNEETDLDFKSLVEGKMHACGHDFHTASLLGAAILLKQRELELDGTIRLLFEPGEERHTGAREMIENGVLNDVSAIAGFHNMPYLPVGTLELKSGKLMASNDNFEVTVHGIGSHAAMPERGTDPIVTVAQMVTMLQTIRSRNIAPNEALVLTVGNIAGGHTFNVIPDHASFKGTIRTYTKANRELAKKRFYEIVESTAKAFDQDVEISWDQGPMPIDNDKTVTTILEEALSDDMNIVPATMSNADDDFAEFEDCVPGFYGFLGSNGNADLHHPDFTCDDAGLEYGAKFHYLAGLALLDAVNAGTIERRD